MSSEIHRKTSIQRFYEGKEVLLTGGTGFLGKILIEKLIRSCPEIRHIYLLVRDKDGTSAYQRLGKLIDDPVFSRLREEQPGWSKRLSVVLGDLHASHLGLSDQQELQLTDSLEVILHAAATLRFDEPLRSAIKTNVMATRELCQLGTRCPKLKAFVYVSTAFTHCDKGLTPETVCSSSVCPEQLIGLTELLDDKALDVLTPVLLGTKPNSYILTKCAAEEVICRFSSTLPVAIFRPSIVLATASEPVPGWVAHVQGPTSVVTGVLAGLLRTIRCNTAAQTNIVPVDYTANALLALAHSLSEKRCELWPNTREVPVMNFVSPKGNSLTWGTFRDSLVRHVRLAPSSHLMWYPTVLTPRGLWLATSLCFLLHHMPAIIIDHLSLCCGRPTKLRKLFLRMDKYSRKMGYFSSNQFEFEEEKAVELWQNMKPEDQQLFPFNMSDFHWDEYMSKYVQGCRKYLLKEPSSTIPRARRRLNFLYGIHLATKFVFCLLTFRFLWFLIRLVKTE